MKKSKKKVKTANITKRHKRKRLDFRFPHIRIAGIILMLSVATLGGAWILNVHNFDFWSSILSNIFAGLITGLVICLISGAKQISIAELESQRNFLKDLSGKIQEFQMLYRELLKKPFSQYDGSEDLFEFIYNVGCQANLVNESIIDGLFDDRLAIDPREYCKGLGYDAVSYIGTYDELHMNLQDLNAEHPTKKQIIQYFYKVEKLLRRLGYSVCYKQKSIESKLERINYSLF